MRRQILNRGLLTVAAASSILAVTGGYAHAAPAAEGGQNAPGHSAEDLSQQDRGAASASSAATPSAGSSTETDAAAIAAAANTAAASGGGATAQGNAEGSPGVLSGNNVSVPVHVPLNVCGNSVDVVGLLNPSFGNSCANGTPAPHVAPPAPAATPQAPAPEVHTQLAETGASGGAMGAAAGASALLLVGGTLIYRRSARAARIRRTYS